jgi:ornithine carbamoyltransferase
MSIRHLLSISDFSQGELRQILSTSRVPSTELQPVLKGQGVALIFEKASNRTRHSMEMAVTQLGGHPVYTRGEEIGLDVRETVEDAAAILCGYHSVIAARVYAHETVVRMSKVSSVPVVNMLSDWSHPLQALADLLTMEQHCGPINDLTVSWVGDYNNVARSLAEGVLIFGGHMKICSPSSFAPDDIEIRRLQQFGDSLTVGDDLDRVVAGSDVVHTDTWISMGQESESEMRRKVFAPYQVNEQLMSVAGADAKFMHCMPAHRDEEVTAEVFDGSRSLVIAQGHNRMHSARGALAFLAQERS